MTDLAKKFADDALLLPREDRAELIDKLLIMEHSIEQAKDYCMKHESTFYKIL